MKNRFCAALLTAALTCSLCLPVSAASPSSFEDVTNDTVAVNADVLRLMGVVSGVGGNRFNPGASLTRAEFCVMVTNFIQRGSEVSRYAARTIFSDVAGGHWARGYINLMATPMENGTAMISGVGNGSFAPDQQVTVAQAVTVLLRVLGYTNQETGFIWPQGYMDFAASIGLTDSVSQNANTVITRAETAQLFVNALGCPTKDGQAYYESLGSVSKDTILLAVGVTSDDSSSNSAIRTSLDGEAFLPAAGEVAPLALQGKRGALVLNERGEIVTFFPDDSNSTTVTLSGSAQPSYIKGTDGKRYTMSASTLLYTADNDRGVSYIEGYTSLRSGTQVTLFTQSGKITAVYAAGSTSASDSAVVIKGTATESTFTSLTGGASGYSIVKNGQTVIADELKTYDVVTYDRLNNTLLASDLRLVGIYEDAYPNAEAPQTVTALGATFEVLDSAWEDIADIDVGDEVCLLLTADGKVAGLEKPGSGRQSTAVGLASDSGVEVFLPNGNSLPISGTISGTKSFAGQLVTLKERDSKGRLTVEAVAVKNVPDSFDPAALTLGDLKVSAGVRVFDQVKDSVMAEIALSDLGTETIAQKAISAYHTNTSGYVDYIILDNLTGSVYQYGMCTLEMEDGERYLTFENGTGSGVESLQTPVMFQNGQFAGLAMGSDGKVKSIVSLEKLEKVSPSDFVTRNGSTYLDRNGVSYLVSDDVVCYKQVNKLWFTQETGSARLAACRAFSDTLTVYCDPFVNEVRIVVAE